MQRRIFLAGSFLLCVLGAARTTWAQDSKSFKPEELDQLLAPIALYPDSLLSQILMGAGYPLEIVEAARIYALTALRYLSNESTVSNG